MPDKKYKNEQVIESRSPLKNLLTLHLLIYILAVTLILWDMTGWIAYYSHTINDRLIVFGIWGAILFMHYCYSRLSGTIDLLRKAFQTNQIENEFVDQDEINDLDYQDEALKVKRLSN